MGSKRFYDISDAPRSADVGGSPSPIVPLLPERGLPQVQAFEHPHRQSTTGRGHDGRGM